MSFDGKEFLNLARFLAGDENAKFGHEAADRSAVSRAYYAAFWHAREYAASNLGYIPAGTVDDHASLRAHLRFHQRGKISAILDRMRRHRNSCDYGQSEGSLQALVTNTLAEAEQVLRECT